MTQSMDEWENERIDIISGSCPNITRHIPDDTWPDEKIEWYLDSWKTDDGKWYSNFSVLDNETEIKSDLGERIMEDLGFCNCGSPWEVLDMLEEFLNVICEKKHIMDTGHLTTGKKPSKEICEIQADWESKSRERTFVFYWADFVKITEHSGSVNGSCWATELAWNFYGLIRAYQIMQRRKNNEPVKSLVV